MKHLGDITLIKGNEAPVVDCIVGGSPCQDLSLAGKRAGLAGARSGLYMEQIRIIKEMRENDRNHGRSGVDIRPRYMVWENVPGAFSTNQGQDFAAVLEEAIRVAEPEAPSVPVPEKGWPTAGCIVGEQWSVAWRVLDAQFWGPSDKPLPQRRRRLALVADFGGLSASEILFVRKSVSGNLEPGKPKGKEAPRDAGEGSGGAVPCTLKIRGGIEGGGKGALIQTDKSATLSTLQDQTLFQPVMSLQGSMIGRADQNGPQGDGINEDVSFTLNTTDRHAVAYGIGSYHSNAWKSNNPDSGVYVADTSKTLDSLNCGYPGCNQGGMAVVQPVAYSIENHPADSRVDIDDSGKVQTLTSRMGTGGGNVPMVMEPVGEYWDGSQIAGTLTANNAGGGQRMPDKENFNCVIQVGTFQNTGVGWWNESDVGATLRTPCGGDATKANLVVAGVDCRNSTEYPEMNATLQSDAAHNLNSNNVVIVRHIVRRLTPLECERLQGFPDGWTDIGEWVDSKGKKHKEADSPRYKALGNSIALPPWKWILRKLCACYERDATMASLFDGIGGFPLIWEQLNGKGSCLWASEIEEFPIAVTKLRFGGEPSAAKVSRSQPKAENENSQSLWIDGIGDFKCPVCGNESEYATKHCPDCGEKLIFGGSENG